MLNYKILILVIIAFGVSCYIWFLKSRISDLEYGIIEKEKIISEQDSKLKEQLSTILILETDLKTKKQTIQALELKNNNSTQQCHEMIKNMMIIDDIGETIKESNVLETEDKKNEIQNETEKQYINFRNNIYSSYF